MAQGNDTDDSPSDTESISLLCGLDGGRAKGAVEEMDVAELDQVPKSARCTGESTNSSTSTPSPGLKARQHVNIPPKRLLNKVNSYGETLLHKACRRGNAAKVMMLLQAGINVNIQDYAGWTALHEASAKGDPKVVRKLLEAGANVHARSKEGVTPLHDAASSGHYQVVKLLLQYGSCASSKTLGGLSAIDLAEEEGIKRLLQESQAASQLHIQMNHSHNEPTNAYSGESADTDGATKTSDSQLKRTEIADTNDSCHPIAIEALLEEARRRQVEIAAWPLAGSGDADRLRAALMQIQNVLTEVLAKQELTKDTLAQTLRNVPNRFLQPVFESQMVSLASLQRTLVKMILDHQDLVTKYMNTYKQAGQGQNPEVTPLSRLSSTPTTSVKHVKKTTASTQSLRGKTKTRTYVPKGNDQSSVTHPGRTSQHADFGRRQEDTQTLPTSEDQHRHLAGLLEAGVLSRSSALRLSLKGQVHVARVMAKGALKDSQGKQFLTPTDWLQSIVGDNVPVSSADVWDKVTHRGRPLSYYLLKAAGNTAQTGTEDTLPRRDTRYSQEEEVTEAAALKRLMNIRIIHLVNDEELMPISVLDSHWERALSGDW